MKDRRMSRLRHKKPENLFNKRRDEIKKSKDGQSFFKAMAVVNQSENQFKGAKALKATSKVIPQKSKSQLCPNCVPPDDFFVLSRFSFCKKLMVQLLLF